MQCDNHNHTLLIIIIIFISTQKTVPKHIKHAKKVIKMQNAVIFLQDHNHNQLLHKNIKTCSHLILIITVLYSM